MRANPTIVTLPQLLDRYRAASTGVNGGELNDLIRLTFLSTAVDGSFLTLPQTRKLFQTGKLTPDQTLTDQYRMVDHHQALEQMLAMASQREPLNRIALQEVAAKLMAQTGGPVYSLLSQIDTRKGDLRIDQVMVGRRVIVAAHKLPAAIDALLKGINTRITQLNTPRQIYTVSFEAHFQLLSLHPFGAGNGPMARLLMTYIQHYHHLPLSLVYVDHQLSYRTALEASWQQQTAIPIVEFLHRQLVLLLSEDIDRLPGSQAIA